jgi:hypothetical protein
LNNGYPILTHLIVMQTGDSGSWVVDAESLELYGHVVASNVFGQVYVVPIGDIFEDIRHRLSAQSVSLPSNSLSSRETHVAAKDPATAWGISQGMPFNGSTSKDVPTIPTALYDEALLSPQLGTPQLGTPQMNSNPPQPAPYMYSVPIPSQPLSGCFGSAPLPYGPHSTTTLQPEVFGSSQNPTAFPTFEYEFGYATDHGLSGISGGHPSLSSSSNPLNQIPLEPALMNYQYEQASDFGWGSPAPSPYVCQPDSGYSSLQVSPTPETEFYTSPDNKDEYYTKY